MFFHSSFDSTKLLKVPFITEVGVPWVCRVVERHSNLSPRGAGGEVTNWPEKPLN